MNLTTKIKAIHPLQWIFEPFEENPSFLQKKMFGCEAMYLGETLTLVIAGKEEPWNGLFVCTSRDQHESLIKDFPQLNPHPMLGKWLYLSQSHEQFEEVANSITNKILKGDPRIGVETQPKRKRKRKQKQKQKRNIKPKKRSIKKK